MSQPTILSHVDTTTGRRSQSPPNHYQAPNQSHLLHPCHLQLCAVSHLCWSLWQFSRLKPSHLLTVCCFLLGEMPQKPLVSPCAYRPPCSKCSPVRKAEFHTGDTILAPFHSLGSVLGASHRIHDLCNGDKDSCVNDWDTSCMYSSYRHFLGKGSGISGPACTQTDRRSRRHLRPPAL
jgi:hypothetical protein